MVDAILDLMFSLQIWDVRYGCGTKPDVFNVPTNGSSIAIVSACQCPTSAKQAMPTAYAPHVMQVTTSKQVHV